MKTFFALCFLAVVVAGTARAAEINVRSGAHSTFARIVLDVPPGTDWDLQQDASGARIILKDHSDGFDVSNVFDRIDQSFITAVEAEATSLSIAFGCSCQADAFYSGPSMIVIDVGETDDPSEGSQLEVPAPAPQIVGSQQLQSSPEAAKRDASDFLPPAMIPPSDPQIRSSDLPAPTQTTEPLHEEQLASLRQTQQKLAEHIGLAATTGILRANSQRTIIPDADRRPQIDTRIFDSSLPDYSDAQLTEPLAGNLRITTSSDIPANATEALSASTTLGVRCIDPSIVRVQDWGGTLGFAGSIAELRGDLFSEFDTLEETKAVELARTYLHYGFGAEARQVLFMTPELAAENRALIDIARIMEFGSAGSNNYLKHFVDCDSDVALWAILSVETLRPSATINDRAAIRAISSLPLHLRQFLAPNLSKKLLAYGDEDAAAAALRGLERTSEPLSQAGELAKADLELAQGDVKAAQDRLEGIVASNEQQSAEALIRYVDTHLDAEVDIEEDIATLVEAYAVEMRNDPLGEELRRTHVLALAKSDQFDAAFLALDQVGSKNDKESTNTLHSSVISLLARNANDATFLQHAFSAMATRSEDMSVRAVTYLAERLANLGFYNEAEHLFSIRSDMPTTREYRIMRASVSLGLAKPREALAFLGAIEGEIPDRLRARAREQAGDYELAHAIYEALGDDTRQLRTAWLSEDWQLLLEADEPVLGAAVKVASSSVSASPDLDGMLGRTEEALDESEQARIVIRQLLTVDNIGTTGEN